MTQISSPVTQSSVAIPLLLLAGAGTHARSIAKLQSDHLYGYKATFLNTKGAPIIDVILRRLRTTKLFDPIIIAGPTRVLGFERAGAKVIDTDSSIGDNFIAGLTHIRESVAPKASIAVMLTDILPTVEDLTASVSNFSYDKEAVFWYSLIPASECDTKKESSTWKPMYSIREKANEQRVLPGHLVIIRPDLLDLRLIGYCATYAYASRNRHVLTRIPFVMFELFRLLLRGTKLSDSGRLPGSLMTRLYAALTLGFLVAARRATLALIAQKLVNVFGARSLMAMHHNSRPSGRIEILSTPSLARDIDTEEEARRILDHQF